MNKEVNTFVSKIEGITPDIRKKKMSNPIVHDFVETLFAFDKVVKSKQIKKHFMEELKELIDARFVRNKNYFGKNDLIKSYYKFIKIIFGYFYDKSI